jgi:hypothetical protein
MSISKYSNKKRMALSVVALTALTLSTSASALLAASSQIPQGLLDSLMSGRFSPAITQAVEQANSSFISQYPSRFNPDASRRNNNCGPACLAMALRIFGHGGSGASPEVEIRNSRRAMTGTSADRLTGMNDVMRGARRNGLTAYIARTMADIDEGLEAGDVAVVSGSPSTDVSYGGRLHFPHTSSGHFVLVTKKVGDSYILSDPESPNGAYTIDRKELLGFIYYYDRGHSQHGAVMLGAG